MGKDVEESQKFEVKSSFSREIRGKGAPIGATGGDSDAETEQKEQERQLLFNNLTRCTAPNEIRHKIKIPDQRIRSWHGKCARA